MLSPDPVELLLVYLAALYGLHGSWSLILVQPVVIFLTASKFLWNDRVFNPLWKMMTGWMQHYWVQHYMDATLLAGDINFVLYFVFCFLAYICHHIASNSKR